MENEDRLSDLRPCTSASSRRWRSGSKACRGVPGLQGDIRFGADGGQPGCILATPQRPVVEVVIPLPDGALDPAGKGIGCELQAIPGAWGRNLPLDAEISPIEIR